MNEELGGLMFCGSSCTICEAYEAEKTLNGIAAKRNSQPQQFMTRFRICAIENKDRQTHSASSAAILAKN
jgi:hypothetical protein